MVCENTVVKLIGHDGNIDERKLGESSVHLKGVRCFQHILLIVTGIPFTAGKTVMSVFLSDCGASGVSSDRGSAESFQ